MGKSDTLKKCVEAVKELVTDGKFDCSKGGMSLQAMDSSHVALVALLLRADGFDHYRCDKPVSLGIKLVSLAKVLKCAGNDDVLTMKAEEERDAIAFTFEDPKNKKFSEFDLKLMDIESDTLGIPDTEYKASVTLPSSEFQRIVRDLGVLGDTVMISATKEGVKFSVSGDMGTGSVTLRQAEGAMDDDEEDKDAVNIDLVEPVSLTFALRYLGLFAKAAPLSDSVTLSLSPDVPLVVNFQLGEVGNVKFYLAPKLGDEDDAEPEDNVKQEY